MNLIILNSSNKHLDMIKSLKKILKWAVWLKNCAKWHIRWGEFEFLYVDYKDKGPAWQCGRCVARVWLVMSLKFKMF